MRLLRRLARRGVRLSAWNHTTHHPTDASSYVSLHPAGHDSNSSSSSGPPDHGAKSDSIGGGIAGNDSLVETQRTVAMDPSRGAPGTPPPPTSRPAGLDHNQKGPLLGTSSSSSSSSSSSRTSNIGPYAALTVTTSGSNHNTSSSTATTTTTTRVVVVETVVSQLVQELASAPDTGSDQAARALRMLFAVSEYGGGDTNTTNSNRDNDTRNKNTNIKPAGGGLEDIRQAMIADGTLVPALLRFLEHCRIEKAVRDRNNNNGRSPSSSSRSVPHQNTSATTNAQVSLALLVLNNISIPVANKRRVALGTNNNSNGGMAVLCRLLGDDPSCRLVVIVLVNLTFCDATLRRDLIYTADIYLFPVLAYAFRVASLTRNEYNQRKPHLGSAASTAAAAKGWTTETSTVNNPVQRLSALLALEESLLVKTKKSFNCVTTTTPMVSSWPLPRDQMFPDTARWCVCAMQNLTRPGIDATSNPAAFALINTGIIPYLLRCIDVGGVGSLSPRRLLQGKSTALSSSSSSGTRDGTPEPSEPPDDWNHEVTNHPSKWAKETAQDATLYVVMNMVTVPSACKFLLNNEDTVSLLVGIAECGKHLNEVGCDLSVHEKQVTIFQCMKARIALAYLACSDKSLSMVRSSRLILVSKADVEQLVDVLGHTLHRRPKPHPGGFSASTFSLKYVLRAVWTILANPKNQEQFAETNMEMVNAFFIKILALHAFQKVSFVDAESAEYACHSLYLLSHYGFHTCFLPYSLGKNHNVRPLVTKILLAVQGLQDATEATCHAAHQLIGRVPHLLYNDTSAVQAANSRGKRRVVADFTLTRALIAAAQQIEIPETVLAGAIPRPDIFNRTVVRTRTLFLHSCTSGDEDDSADCFPSALHAVQDLSLSSYQVWQMDNSIDEIAIANKIASCAEGSKLGVKPMMEAFGFAWGWKDYVASPILSPTNGSGTLLSAQCHSFSLQNIASSMSLPNLCGSPDMTTP